MRSVSRCGRIRGRHGAFPGTREGYRKRTELAVCAHLEAARRKGRFVPELHRYGEHPAGPVPRPYRGAGGGAFVTKTGPVACVPARQSKGLADQLKAIARGDCNRLQGTVPIFAAQGALPSPTVGPTGPTPQQTIGPLGRIKKSWHLVPQGGALGWANSWAFGPHFQAPRNLAAPSRPVTVATRAVRRYHGDSLWVPLAPRRPDGTRNRQVSSR